MTQQVTHVLVGYSPVMLAKLDTFLPPRSVLVLEEPGVIEARGAAAAVAGLRCVAELRPAPTQDEEHPERVIEAVERPAGVRVVVPAAEYGVVIAAALAEAWGLPGASPKAAKVLRDKAVLRATVAGSEIGQPAFATVTSAEEVEAFRAAYGRQVVVKPANRQASLGVQLLDEQDDSAAAWAHAVEADEPALRATYEGAARFLVEQRLYGPEVSVEAIVHEGLVGFVNVTAKSVQDSKYPVETGHALPADLPSEVNDALRQAIQQLATVVGFCNGILHAEWILADGRPHLVECAGRLPGDGITVLLDLAYDSDVLANLIQVLSGEGAVPELPVVQGASVRFVTAPPGVVRSVDAEEAKVAEGVFEVHLNLAAGSTVKAATSSWERAGFVIAAGPTTAEAVRRAEHAAGLVEIKVGAE
ncbi:ATP-grasp domain-containing protein [Kitasatospora sp. NPDC002227]|uniref:ATP-grasp domain-containing protein n=1 Tax=Kitasatospora sp. NPDC002227 TaxID=3154773 RepID=UPI003320E46E